MNNRQSAHYNSFMAVRSFLAAEQGTWSSLPSFVAAEAAFQTMLTKLEEANATHGADISGATLQKADRRAELTAALVRLSAAVCSLALATGNSLLQLLVYTTTSELDAMSDDAFRGRSYLILEQTQPQLPSLPPHGITAVDFSAVETLFAQWRQAELACVSVRAGQKAATADVGRLIREIGSLLATRMDPLVTVIGAANPRFADGWKSVRKIIDPATRTRALRLRVTTLVGGLSQPVSGAVAVIHPGGLRKATGEGGIFYVQSLKPGAYTLELSKPGYKDSGPIAFVVARGEGAEVEVVLVPEDAL